MRYNSARQMIFDAYRMTGDSVMAGAIDRARLGNVVQATQKQNNDWRIVHGLEAGAVISGVEALPTHLRALALYLFGPFTQEELAEDRETVEIAVYRKLLADRVKLPGQGKGLPTVEQLKTLRYLCGAALFHHGEVTWPYQRTGLPTPRAVQRWMLEEHGLEVDVRRWSASGRACWGNVWERLVTTLDRWEGQALAPVAGLIPEAA